MLQQRPEKLNQKPSVLPAVEVIAPGGSYNPDFLAHQVRLSSAKVMTDIFILDLMLATLSIKEQTLFKTGCSSSGGFNRFIQYSCDSWSS